MENRLIFDVGMHKGEDTEYYLRRGCSVVAVEANPRLAEAAALRLSEYVRSGQLRIINKAIAETNGPITFYDCETASIWGTIDKSWAERNLRLGARVKEITVEGIRLNQIIEQFGAPYYMKVDIEGADVLCLRELLDRRDRPKYISIESSKRSFEELIMEFCLFQNLGYRKYKIVPQHRITSQRVPKPPLEGIYINHEFKLGCSGLFGLELPGEWLTLEQAVRNYLGIFRFYRIVGDGGALTSHKVIRGVLNKARVHPRSLTGIAIKSVIKPLGALVGLKSRHYDTHAMYTGP